MRLEQLLLYNFRNIERTELHPHHLFNIFYGDNAQGKTNLLESISLLGSLKSFRLSRNDELIKNNESYSEIKGETEKNGVKHQIKLRIDKENKQAWLDGKRINRPEAYLDCLRPVVFAPEEVNLIKGPPSGRRRLLDRAVFQTDNKYLADVQKYDRQLKQRNRLLKEKRPENELAPWTDELAKTGAAIRHARSRYIEKILPQVKDCYLHICGQQEQVNLFCKADTKDISELEQNLLDEFERQKEQEKRYGVTLSGPHRDDIDFLLNQRPLKSYGSQGQQRSFILAFKVAQALHLKEVYGEPPLLLFDDLTGELDRHRQNLFFEFLLSLKAQVFITTTEVQPLLDGGIRDGYFIRVEQGVFTTTVSDEV
ncbi:MAG: DNA replication/repair protein RecF [Desulfuromonas sp.]|nr:MAG: DNA replication/repair protein RecF [Desulfuromonas sp.]